MITWGDYRDVIRRSVLKDDDVDPQKNRWKDDVLRDCLWWSLNQFAHHTAYITGVYFEGATQTQYDLPDNIYDNLMESGRVYYRSTTDTNANPVTLVPVETPVYALTPKKGEFSVLPDTILRLGEAPGSDKTLYITYYAYYPRPYDDADKVLIPQWAELPVAQLVAANALIEYSIRSANINQWKDKTDSGNPEHNALRAQSDYFLKRYEYEINRVPRQNRSSARPPNVQHR